MLTHQVIASGDLTGDGIKETAYGFEVDSGFIPVNIVVGKTNTSVEFSDLENTTSNELITVNSKTSQLPNSTNDVDYAIKNGQLFYDTVELDNGSIYQVPEGPTAGGNDPWDAIDGSDDR